MRLSTLGVAAVITVALMTISPRQAQACASGFSNAGACFALYSGDDAQCHKCCYDGYLAAQHTCDDTCPPGPPTSDEVAREVCFNDASLWDDQCEGLRGCDSWFMSPAKSKPGRDKREQQRPQ